MLTDIITMYSQSIARTVYSFHDNTARQYATMVTFQLVLSKLCELFWDWSMSTKLKHFYELPLG